MDYSIFNLFFRKQRRRIIFSMDIKVIEPSGFCFGVKKAIDTAKKAKDENIGKQIYIVGALVHNEEVTKELENEGFIILDECEKPLKDHLENLNDGSVIVFSAHGHAPYLDEIAKRKNMKIYDATCIFVKNNEKSATKVVENGGEVIYIGIENHAETNGMIGINDKKIHIYTPGMHFDFSKINSSEPLIISQTTMSKEEIKTSIETIKKNIPGSIVSAKQCFETERRQSEALAQGANYDCFIVIGGKNSNNTKRLALILKEAYPSKECFLILNETELKGELDRIAKHEKIMIVSGASTADSTIYACLRLIYQKNK